MNITVKKLITTSVAVSLGLGMAAAGASAASAATGHWTPEGTPEPYYLYSMDTGVVVPAGTTLGYSSGIVAAPSITDPEIRFAPAPADAESSTIFISPIGSEAVMSSWLSKTDIGLDPVSKQVLQPTASLDQFPATTFAAVKAAGGAYSLGFAYTKNNGVTYVGLGGYTHVNITAGTAAWTFDTPTWVEDVVTPPVDPAQSGQIGIEATTVGATNGALSLSVPAAAKATLGAATLVNNLSTSTGTLPTITVNDARVVSKQGWTLNSKTTAFTRVGGTESFDPAALSITPQLFADGTTSTGVTLAGKLSASLSDKKLAEAPAGSGIGVTKINADLALVAPAETVAGTYTSTMTVTVVSK